MHTTPVASRIVPYTKNASQASFNIRGTVHVVIVKGDVKDATGAARQT
jgi:hypothetical protein